MEQRKKAVFNWSGGKDSALALQKVLQGNELEVVSLLTTINEDTQASSIHAIPLEILSRQAESIGIPLYAVALEKKPDDYDDKMREATHHFKRQGVTHFIFGDIFLADVRKYREDRLTPLGIEVVEPLWSKSSAEVMDHFLQSGIKTKIIVTQADKLDGTFIGKELNRETINLFPKDIDICGENGEYHTLAYAGGIFRKEVKFSISRAKKISYDFKLDDGQTKTYSYWQGELSV